MTIPEFINFLTIAKRSSAETRSHLYDFLDEKYISDSDFNSLSNQCNKVCKMLASLIHYLQSLNQTYKRTYISNKPVNQETKKPINQ